jgi:hypothetical protein
MGILSHGQTKSLFAFKSVISKNSPAGNAEVAGKLEIEGLSGFSSQEAVVS